MAFCPQDIEELAHCQLGRFTRAQVADRTDRAPQVIRSQLRSGRWRRESSRVLSLPGAPRGWGGDLWTGWLHVGRDSVVSHFSAARIHGLPVDPEEPDSLTVPRGSNRRYRGWSIRQRSDVGVADVAIVDGLPVTRPARLLFDLANELSPARLDAWLDDLTISRRVTPAQVAAAVERLSKPGRRAVPGLITAVTRRLPDSGLAQGPLERALAQIVVLADMPPGVAQYAHPGSATGSEFVDRAWPEARLVVEADGRCWHDRLSAARNDSRRDLDAAAAGWQTVRIRHDQLVGDPATTARLLRDTYEARLSETRRAALGDSSAEVESPSSIRDPGRLHLGA